MDVVQKLDDIGKPAWIGLMIISFIIFWPIGLALLIYLIGSGRMGFWKNSAAQNGHPMGRFGCGRRYGFSRPTTGNRAFDEYRSEALRRLEDEQREFTEFLDRLRQARDKSEFDQFMAERNRKSSAPPAPEPA